MSRSLFIFCMSCLLLPLISKAQHRYDIQISECLPDSSPVVGMPESSFIELKNRSPNDYNLHNWEIANGLSSVTIKTDYLRN